MSLQISEGNGLSCCNVPHLDAVISLIALEQLAARYGGSVHVVTLHISGRRCGSALKCLQVPQPRPAVVIADGYVPPRCNDAEGFFVVALQTPHFLPVVHVPHHY